MRHKKQLETNRHSENADDFINRLSDEYGNLSKQLKTIARYIEHHRDHIGLLNIRDISGDCKVQPSAVVRFAKHFGYSGYSQMQEIFRRGIAKQIVPSMDYQERIRNIIEFEGDKLTKVNIADEFVRGALGSLVELQRDFPIDKIDAAVEYLSKARQIWIIGARRSFPVASYLHYALLHTDKQINLFDGVGFVYEHQLKNFHKDDVLIVISFFPYAKETINVINSAKNKGTKIITITDNLLNPLAQQSNLTIPIRENAVFGFRSLTCTMTLVQALFVALAFKIELKIPLPVTEKL